MISVTSYQNIICKINENKLSIDSLSEELESMKSNLSSLNILSKYYNYFYNEINYLENKLKQLIRENNRFIYFANKHVEDNYGSLYSYIIENEVYHTIYTAETSQYYKFIIPEAYIVEDCNIVYNNYVTNWDEFDYSNWDNFTYFDWDQLIYS